MDSPGLSTPPRLPQTGLFALDPSELGTKEYWDNHYMVENLDREDDEDETKSLPDPLDLETWFDDVGAPAKILAFLTSSSFPLSVSFLGSGNGFNKNSSFPAVLDLGTGNGSSLFTLRLQGSYYGKMVGVDYSPQSIEVARRLGRQYSDPEHTTGLSVPLPPAEYACDKIQFEVLDFLNQDPRQQSWWPSAEQEDDEKCSGFDLVLDKGTFDAISLSADTIVVGTETIRIHEIFPRIAVSLLKPRGFFLITSCNWTEEEIVRWFTLGRDVAGKLEVFARLSYPVFEFGGRRGQSVASVCFQRQP